jgi:dihydrofolate synthase/folylpolyglutamate synthase
VIADASHNPEGIKNLVKNISGYFGKRRKIIIFAVLGDKDYREMISSILGVSDILILTSSLNSRSLDIGKLQNEVLKIKNLREEKKKNVPSNIYSMDNIENSLNFALNFSKSNDIICITGSITNLENLGGMIC